MDITPNTHRKKSSEVGSIPDISVSAPLPLLGERGLPIAASSVSLPEQATPHRMIYSQLDDREKATAGDTASSEPSLSIKSSESTESVRKTEESAKKEQLHFKRSSHDRRSSSREGSIDRQSLELPVTSLLQQQRSRDETSIATSLSVASTPSIKGSNDDIASILLTPRSRTGSISNISAISSASAAIKEPHDSQHQHKKSPALTASLAPTSHRHSSDASSVASSTGKSTGKGSEKKRQRWYQSLYPTYKQRSEEFKKLFPLVAEKERLLIDYSCALQRDILVQGRLYISQYHICFYAKIIAWETNICTAWKSVTALTKERTAKIIPNALSYTTDHDQYYFTSFGQRDKTFTNLYRIWQGAVKEQPMSTQEMWSFVHYQYGDELGLTSEDEDYVQPAYLRSFPEGLATVNGVDEDDHNRPADDFHTQVDRPMGADAATAEALANSPSNNSNTLATDGTTQINADVSSSSGSDQGDEALYIPAPPANGQTFIDHEFRIPFDQLFLVMFSESKLLKEMFVRRKFLETNFGQWNLDPTTDCQVRHVKYCLLIGPKTIRTEERQTLLKESVSGRLHLVDSVAQNHGAPYSDSFSVVTHYVLHKIAPNTTRVRVATEVVFRKANWAVKAILEKGVMDQLRDYMADYKGRLSGMEAEIATQEHDVAPESGPIPARRLTLSRRDLAHTPSRSEAGDAAGRRSVSFSRLTNSDMDTTAGRQARDGRGQQGAVRKMVYIILVLLFVNFGLYFRVWDWSSDVVVSTCAKDDARCGDKRSDWMNLVSRFSQPENAHLLHSLNDGLASVMKGLQTISAALEDLQTNMASSTAATAPVEEGHVAAG